MSDAYATVQKPWLSPELADPDGLAGVGGDLNPTTLLLAYSEGVFPWFNQGDPVLWWSPDPRAIIEIDSLHVSRRLARTIASGKFTITFDTCFETIMQACGEDRPEGTWITPTMLEAYGRLHMLGYAHSVEVWCENQLAGGLYGVSLGGLFSAESMFHRVTDGSKVAMVALMAHAKARGYELVDVQMTTEHTQRMGAVNITRTAYLKRLKKAIGRQVRFV
ncbi:leucyl/phenylalanyl-tRNA--protein transferase [soil metagenome]